MLSSYRVSSYGGLYGAYGGMSEGQTLAVAKAWWVHDWDQRKYHPEALVLGPTETLLILANGGRPTFATAPLEYRATIKGGLLALARAGVVPWAAQADAIGKLPTKMTPAQKNDEDDQLTKFVGLSGHKMADLKAAAVKVRNLVTKNKVEAQAWGLRGLLILQQAKILEAAHGAVVSVLAAVPPAWIAAAIGAAHAGADAVTTAILDKKFNTMVSVGEKQSALLYEKLIDVQTKKGEKDAKKRQLQAERDAQARLTLAASQRPPATNGISPMLLIGGALLLGSGLLFALKRRSAGAA